jgi:hypothetical protein
LKCRKCHLEKPEWDFPTDNHRLVLQCRQCKSAHDRALRLSKPRSCTVCGEVKQPAEFSQGRRSCRKCKSAQTQARTKARGRDPKRKKDQVYDSSKNTNASDRYENAWDLGKLSDRDRVCYLRGIWVGWKRGLDSHSNLGPGDGNLLAGYLSQVLASAELPEDVKGKLYRAGRRLAEDYLSPRPTGISMEEIHGQKGA